MHPDLHLVAEFFGHAMHHHIQCRAQTAPSSPFDGVPNQLAQLLQEMKKMSDTQNAVKTDVAQMASDLSSLTGAYKTLTDKVASLQAAAASTPSVPAELQTQIDALHAFAQSVTPPAAVDPTTTQTPPADTTTEPAPGTTSADTQPSV